MSQTLSENPTPISGDDNGGDSKQIPVEEWLPITESRNGNIYTVTFHLFCSGLGIQVLLVPAAFAALGWVWGMVVLTVGFAWKLYTAWILVHLHEAVNGIRFSRFVKLAVYSFGVKLGKLLGIFPVMYLSGGACSVLVITGGNTIKQLLQIMSEDDKIPLTPIQCFFIFSCIAVVLSQFPNLNSLFGLTIFGTITAMAYCTTVWILPLTNVPQNHKNISYEIPDRSFDNIFNAIGLIVLAFRGNNLILEIQATLPSGPKNNPTRKTMWKAVIISHIFLAICMFPVAIVIYWAHGDKIPPNGGPLGGYLKLYEQGYSKSVACFIHFTFLFNCLCTYPITLMPACDNVEILYTTKRQKPCSVLVRGILRMILGLICFFISVAFPFLPYLAVLIGAVALLVTFTYPCFMWISVKKPQRKDPMWFLNALVGTFGASLSILLVISAALRLEEKGLHANFFKP